MSNYITYTRNVANTTMGSYIMTSVPYVTTSELYVTTSGPYATTSVPYASHNIISYYIWDGNTLFIYGNVIIKEEEKSKPVKHFDEKLFEI